ncbi:MAG: DUF1499 domain-containing protein [Maricaulaceae bacterium]
MSMFKMVVGLGLLIVGLLFLLGLKSQKGEAKGLLKGRLSDCGSAPNCVSSEADTQPEKEVPPFKANLREVRAAIITTGGTITREQDGYISATYMSKLFKFVDDFEVRDTGAGVIHVRSSSRVGFSDRGVNRKRVKAIRDALSVKISA